MSKPDCFELRKGALISDTLRVKSKVSETVGCRHPLAMSHDAIYSPWELERAYEIRSAEREREKVERTNQDGWLDSVWLKTLPSTSYRGAQGPTGSATDWPRANFAPLLLRACHDRSWVGRPERTQERPRLLAGGWRSNRTDEPARIREVPIFTTL